MELIKKFENVEDAVTATVYKADHHLGNHRVVFVDDDSSQIIAVFFNDDLGKIMKRAENLVNN